jgi:hypothetical protein
VRRQRAAALGRAGGSRRRALPVTEADKRPYATLFRIALSQLCDEPRSATPIPLTVSERYVGKTTTGAKVTFSVTHPDNNRSSLSVGHFAVGEITAECNPEVGFPTRVISFSDGSVSRIKNGRFSNGEGAPASSSDADLAFVASGRLTGNNASGVVAASDPDQCGYGPIHWIAKRVTGSTGPPVPAR